MTNLNAITSRDTHNKDKAMRIANKLQSYSYVDIMSITVNCGLWTVFIKYADDIIDPSRIDDVIKSCT